MTEPELDKKFKLSNEALADFLRDIAESLEEDDAVKLDGNEWKLSQPLDDKEKLLRLIKDKEGMEVSFRI